MMNTLIIEMENPALEWRNSNEGTIFENESVK